MGHIEVSQQPQQYSSTAELSDGKLSVASNDQGSQSNFRYSPIIQVGGNADEITVQLIRSELARSYRADLRKA